MAQHQQLPNYKGFFPNVASGSPQSRMGYPLEDQVVRGQQSTLGHTALDAAMQQSMKQPAVQPTVQTTAAVHWSQESSARMPGQLDYQVPQPRRHDRLVNWLLYFCPLVFSLGIAFVDANILYNRIQKSREVNNADHVLDFVQRNLVLDPIQSIVNTIDDVNVNDDGSREGDAGEDGEAGGGGVGDNINKESHHNDKNNSYYNKSYSYNYNYNNNSYNYNKYNNNSYNKYNNSSFNNNNKSYSKYNNSSHNHNNNHHLLPHFQSISSSPCPDGYKLETLGIWPGIEAGCICSGCQKTNEVSAQDMQVWRGSRLCVKHFDSWRWVGVQGECGDEHLKKCGGSGICIPAALPCPLTDLHEIFHGHGGIGAEQKFTIGGHTFSSSTKDGVQPIVGFMMTPGGKLHAPCFNDLVAPEFQSGQYYPLSNQPASGCGRYGMSLHYTISLGCHGVREVYDENQLTPTLLQQPQYEKFIIPGDTYTLQAIRRIKIGSSHICYTINGKKVSEIRVRSDTLHNYTKYLSIIGAVLCLLCIMLFPILFILRKKHFDACNMQHINQFKWFYFLGVAIAISCILMGIVYIIQVDSKVLHNEFQEYLRYDCFVDVYIQKAVQEIDKFATDSYHESSFWILLAFCSSVAYLLGTVTLLLIRRFSFRESWFQDPWKK